MNGMSSDAPPPPPPQGGGQQGQQGQQYQNYVGYNNNGQLQPQQLQKINSGHLRENV